MTDQVQTHYAGGGDLADEIAARLEAAGKNLAELTTGDLATVDEFHIRGRKATLELGRQMGLSSAARVLDMGSGLGGPARTLAEEYGCHVTGIDLTPAFCDAASRMSDWVNLGDRVRFQMVCLALAPGPTVREKSAPSRSRNFFRSASVWRRRHRVGPVRT